MDATIFLRSGCVVCFQKAAHDDGRKVIDFAAVKQDGDETPWPTMPDLLDKTWRDSVTVLPGLGGTE